MAKISVVVIQSVNGCFSDDVNDALWNYPLAASDLKNLVDSAVRDLTEGCPPISELIENHSDEDYIIELYSDNAEYVGKLLSRGLVRSFVVYTVPMLDICKYSFLTLQRNPMLCTSPEIKILGNVIRITYSLP